MLYATRWICQFQCEIFTFVFAVYIFSISAHQIQSHNLRSIKFFKVMISMIFVHYCHSKKVTFYVLLRLRNCVGNSTYVIQSKCQAISMKFSSVMYDFIHISDTGNSNFVLVCVSNQGLSRWLNWGLLSVYLYHTLY